MFNSDKGIEFINWIPKSAEDSSWVKKQLNKQHINVYLDTDNHLNKAKIKTSNYYLNYLLSKQDTNYAIRYVLNDSVPFQSYVKLIEIVSDTNVFAYNTPLKNYLYVGNELWAFINIIQEPPADTTEFKCDIVPVTCGTKDWNDYFEVQESEASTGFTYPIFILFFLLIVANFVDTIRRIAKTINPA